ncbi:hypothetical protein ACTRXD_15600 [Nitrospira sp. T9]|uniref:hypothetical protein n=1 Tax=unclassified Nitrospira TaxID=2652172 RepID=UPI003F9C8895
MNEQLLKIKEDETKQRISETKQKVELIKISRREWGFRPLLSDYCAAQSSQDIYEICELKNRAKDCSDFQATSRTYMYCSSCVHRMPHGDPYLVLYGVNNTEIHSKMKEGIDAQGAIEMATLYHSKGECHSMPRFHDWCRYFTSGKRYVCLPYPNVHHDCPYHEWPEGESASFLS